METQKSVSFWFLLLILYNVCVCACLLYYYAFFFFSLTWRNAAKEMVERNDQR